MNAQPKTGRPCVCETGIWRDNCAMCEGTGWEINFKAIRARKLTPEPQKPLARSTYDLTAHVLLRFLQELELTEDLENVVVNFRIDNDSDVQRVICVEEDLRCEHKKCLNSISLVGDNDW